MNFVGEHASIDFVIIVACSVDIYIPVSRNNRQAVMYRHADRIWIYGRQVNPEWFGFRPDDARIDIGDRSGICVECESKREYTHIC